MCDTLRTAITGGVEPFDMDQMMELDMEVHHQCAVQPVDSLTTVADSLPGLGIVAAVLGVVITMGALGGPPEEIGKHVAAALVGTFLGILFATAWWVRWRPTCARRPTNTTSICMCCACCCWRF